MGIVIEEREFERFPPFLTWALIGLNVVVFLFQALDPNLTHTFWLVPESMLRGAALYTVITSMFLHGDLVHLISNMYVLYVFGDDCENVYGRGLYLVFYTLCGIGGAVVHSLFTPNPDIPTIGASGAIFGVLAAYAIFFPRRRLYIFFWYGFFPIPAMLFAAMYALFEILYVMAGLNPFIAHTAHIGGFLVGLTLSMIYKWSAKPRIYRTEQRWY